MFFKDRIISSNNISIKPDQLSPGQGPFCMSYGFDLNHMNNSIKEFGLLNRPYVTREFGPDFEIITGHRRIMAMNELGYDKIPCIEIVNSGLDKIQYLKAAIFDNLCTRDLNDIEKGMALNRLSKLLPDDRIIKEYLPLFGMSSHADILSIYIKLEGLHEDIKNGLIDKKFSLKTIRSLIDRDEDTINFIISLISNLMLNFNQQKQFIEYTSEISNIKSLKFKNIFNAEELKSTLNDENLNRPQKAKKILSSLRFARFPRVTESESKFKKTVSDLHLPKGTKISHTPFFEGREYLLEIQFVNGKELKNKINNIAKIQTLETFENPWKEQ